MRTNIVIDNQLMQEAFKYSNLKTKKEIINIALKEFVENAKKLSILDLRGKIDFQEGYDYKTLRDKNVSG